MRTPLVATVFVVALAVSAGPTLAAPIDELRASFTLEGKPVPPEIFATFGVGDLADEANIPVVTVDLLAALRSHLYRDPVTVRANGWVSQRRTFEGQQAEVTSYRFYGATRSGLMITVAASWGGGTGIYHMLYVLDAAPSRAIGHDGMPYDRLNLTVLRHRPLGDRWRGDITISGEAVTLVTEPGEPNNSEHQRTTLTFEAARP